MIRPGPRNALTDVPGVRVGQRQDDTLATGVTAIVPDSPVVMAADVRGGGTGTRETNALRPSGLVDRVHGLVFSGGSAFGLAAADGVMARLLEAGRGFAVADALVPVVPAAIIFDLRDGMQKTWQGEPPYRRLAYTAAEKADLEVALGAVGAGRGATAGPYPGGVGTASAVLDDGTTVAALAVVNAFGSPYIPGTTTLWAWPFEMADEMGGQAPPADMPRPVGIETKADTQPGENTTLVAVGTDIALNKGQTERLAVMAQDGLARAIRPCHTPFDGDVVYAFSTGARPGGDDPGVLTRLGTVAGDCVARAIGRGVWEAGKQS